MNTSPEVSNSSWVNNSAWACGRRSPRAVSNALRPSERGWRLRSSVTPDALRTNRKEKAACLAAIKRIHRAGPSARNARQIVQTMRPRSPRHRVTRTKTRTSGASSSSRSSDDGGEPPPEPHELAAAAPAAFAAAPPNNETSPNAIAIACRVLP